MLVMICHFNPQVSTAPMLTQCISAVVGFGQVGVDLFFALSGFLITGILLRSAGSEGYLRNFYMRRVLRIFPLYYGVLLIFLVSSEALDNGQRFALKDQWWFLLYWQNVMMTFEPDQIVGWGRNLAHFWSLSVEEHFYLFWPLLLAFCPVRYVPRLPLILVGISLVSRAVLL